MMIYEGPLEVFVASGIDNSLKVLSGLVENDLLMIRLCQYDQFFLSLQLIDFLNLTCYV